jgi:hypothetical protein
MKLDDVCLRSLTIIKGSRSYTQADVIQRAASESLRRAEQIDQSILARAFSGELG